MNLKDLPLNTFAWLGDWARRRMLQNEIRDLILDYQTHHKEREAAYERGFKHGKNKTVPLLKKLTQMKAEKDRWRLKYKSEVRSLRYYIEELRKHVPPEVFNQVMQTKRGPRKSYGDKEKVED